jgi:hypothetical protein
MVNKKEPKQKSTNQPKEHKTIAELIQVRLVQLDKKSSNISKQIETLQRKLDNTSNVKSKIEKLKGAV